MPRTRRNRIILRLASDCIAFFFLALSVCSSAQSDLTSVLLLTAKHQWNEAEAKTAQYRQAHPESVDAAILQAEILLHLGLLSDANTALQQVLAVHPHSIEALTAEAELSRTLGDKSVAEALLQRCTRYAPRSAEVWKRLGDLYLQSGRKEALQCFRRARALAPHDPMAVAALANAYHQQGLDADAEENFRIASQLNQELAKSDPSVDYMFAEFLQDKSRCAESIPLYNRSLERNPQFVDARFGRAKCLVHLQQWNRAADDLRLCLQDDDKQIAALNLLTRVELTQGNDGRAKLYSAQAEKLSSAMASEKATNNQIALQLQNAHALMLKKSFAEAAELYRQLIKEHSAVPEAWLRLGECDQGLGDLDKAEDDLRRYVSLENRSASGHLLLGRVLLRKSETEAARHELAQALQIDPLLADARLGIAASYVVEGKYPDAIATLRAATALTPMSIPAHLMLTEALYKNGQTKEAIQEIDRVLKANPANKDALLMKSAMTQPTTAVSPR